MKGVHRGLRDRKWGRVGGWRENEMEVNVKAVSRGQDKLVGKFKMPAGDVISIRGQVLEHTYIPTGIERELVRSGMDGLSGQDCWRRTSAHC